MSRGSCFTWSAFRRPCCVAALCLGTLILISGCSAPPEEPPVDVAPVQVSVPDYESPTAPFTSEAERQAALSQQVNALNGAQGKWERRQQAPPISLPPVAPANALTREPRPVVIPGWDANVHPANPYLQAPSVNTSPLTSTAPVATPESRSAPSYTPASPSYVPPPQAGVQNAGPVYQGKGGVAYMYPRDGVQSQRTSISGGYGGPTSYGQGSAGYGAPTVPAGTSSSDEASQCLGTTQKGQRCRRMTRDPRGYCYQH